MGGLVLKYALKIYYFYLAIIIINTNIRKLEIKKTFLGPVMIIIHRIFPCSNIMTFDHILDSDPPECPLTT